MSTQEYKTSSLMISAMRFLTEELSDLCWDLEIELQDEKYSIQEDRSRRLTAKLSFRLYESLDKISQAEPYFTSSEAAPKIRTIMAEINSLFHDNLYIKQKETIEKLYNNLLDLEVMAINEARLSK